MLFTILVIAVGSALVLGTPKVLVWWDEKKERKMLEGVMRAEIEEDVERRRPSQQEIWDAEREIDEELADIVSK